jgi:hypothetical protein
MTYACEHLKTAAARKTGVLPSDHGCTECLKTGDEWVHLRLCVTCGHVGCCDASKNRHATRHARKTQHPVIRSYEPGESWGYCYPDDAFADVLPALPGEEAEVHYEAP